MSKRVLLISVMLLSVIFIGCNKKKVEDGATSIKAIDNFLSNVKDIELPASEAFGLFAKSLDSLDSEDSNSVNNTFSAMESAIKECKLAATNFSNLPSTIGEAGVEDTVRLLLAGGSVYLATAYQYRVDAIKSFRRYLSLGDKKLLDTYFATVNRAGNESSKAFGAIIGAKVRARSLGNRESKSVKPKKD